MTDIGTIICNFPVKFGKLVQLNRKRNKLTQGDLVSSLSENGITVSQSYISLLEIGERNDPNIKLVIGLAKLLDISIDDLIKGKSNIHG